MNLLTREQAGAALDISERDGRRVLCIYAFRIVDGAPVEDTRAYADFSDTCGGHYTDAGALHDARLYLRVMPSDLLFEVSLAPKP